MKQIKVFLISAVLTFISLKANSQDRIYKTDESVIIAKVLEVSTASVKCKVYNGTSEKVFEISKEDIHYIVYENGTKEIYTTIVEPTYTSPEETATTIQGKNFLKNIIALNCFEMVFTNASFSYERIVNSGKLSIKIPLSVGLQGKPNTQNYTSNYWQTQFMQNRNYAGGIELNIYPLGQTRHLFYVGLSFMCGSFNYYKDSTVYATTSVSYYNPVVDHIKYIGMHYSGMVHLGGYLRMSENFLIGAKIGLGFKREQTIEEDYTLPAAQFDFNLAYRL